MGEDYLGFTGSMMPGSGGGSLASGLGSGLGAAAGIGAATGGLGFLPALGISLGGNLLTNLFGGKSNVDEILRYLKAQRGKQAITDQQVRGYQPYIEKGMAPWLGRMSENISRRIGLDSGAAHGAIAQAGQGQMMQQMGQYRSQADKMNAERQMQLNQLIASMAGR